MKTIKIISSILLALLFTSCESGFDDILSDADLGKAALKSVTLSNGSLSSKFNRGITSYAIYAGTGAGTVTISAVPENSDSTIKCRFGSGAWTNGTSINVTGLTTTPVKVEVEVTSGDGQGVVVYIFRALSGNPPSKTTEGLAYTLQGDGTYSITKGTFTSGVLVIPDYYLGKKVTVIESNAFTGCSGMTGLTIGNNITTIGTAAFRGCTGLTAVTIPDSVITIGADAFYETENITSVVIGNSVVTIGSCAFEDSNPSILVIPDSVTSIADYAFGTCSNLKNLYMWRLSAPTLGNYNFASVTGCTLHLRSGNSGYTVAPWSTAGKFTQVTDL